MTDNQASLAIKSFKTDYLIEQYKDWSKSTDAWVEVLVDLAREELEQRLSEQCMSHLELEIEAEMLTIEY